MGRCNTLPSTCGKATTARVYLADFFASIDLQHIANPAYNQDRGPLWVPSLRLHLEVKLHGTSQRQKRALKNP